MMSESARDPVLETVCKRILQDESRHMGFGMLALPRVVNEASEGERRELEDYTCFALEKTLTGFFPLEAYQDAGFSPRQIDEVKRYRRETAASNDYAPFRKYFKGHARPRWSPTWPDSACSPTASGRVWKSSASACRRADRSHQLAEPPRSVPPQRLELPTHEQGVRGAPERPERSR